MEENKENTEIIKSGRGRPKTKFGQYNNKEYYKNFKEKNQDKIHQVNYCNLCQGKYSYFNKSHHNNSRKHIKAFEKLEKEYLAEQEQLADNHNETI
jgi:hypothetical protein